MDVTKAGKKRSGKRKEYFLDRRAEWVARGTSEEAGTQEGKKRGPVPSYKGRRKVVTNRGHQKPKTEKGERL